jgi:hypothetical protein
MAKHLGVTTGCLEACQKRCEELAAIRLIQLKIKERFRRGQKELFLDSAWAFTTGATDSLNDKKEI